MIKQQSILIRIFLSGLMITCLLASSVLADDTDIYFNSDAGNSAPLIMLSLDYRSNLGSTVCSGTECDFLVASCSNTDSGSDDVNGNNIMSDGSIDFKDDGDLIADVKGKQVCTKPTHFLGFLRAAIRYVFYDINNAGSIAEIKLGIMMNHANINNCEGPENSAESGCSNGGFILHHMTSITSGKDFDKVYKSMHRLSTPDTAGHTYQGAELFFEFYRYLTGQAVYNGHVGRLVYDASKSKWILADDINSVLHEGTAADGSQYQWNWDADAETDTAKAIPTHSAYGNKDQIYSSPITDQCSKVSTMNFIIQVSSQENDSDIEIAKSFADGGLGFSPSANNAFNEVIQKLNLLDLGDGNHGTVSNYNDTFNINVKSYFYVKDNAVSTVQNYATSGGTVAQVISDDAAEFINQLTNDINTILSASSTFVSASIPINVFNKAEFLDNVFLASFEAASEPAWIGNLKRLRIDTNLNKILDVNSNPAFDGNGKIAEEALTYWTNPMGRSVPTTGINPNKDGPIVNAGGAGQKIPGFMGATVTNAGDPGDTNSTAGARQLFTDPLSHAADGSTTSLLAVNVADADHYWSYVNREGYLASGTDLNSELWSTWDDDNDIATDEIAVAAYADADADDQLTATNIMRFIRGQNVTSNSASSEDARDWILGDPLHSRPFPINYGSLGSYTEVDADGNPRPDIRILMGSNDGYLRMFLNSDPDGTANGKEVWAFMPRELMAIQKRLMDNAVDAGAIVHPYGLDGTPVIYAKDSNVNSTLGDVSEDIVQTFFGLRRGGKSYYALDISDPNVPAFKWKISKTSLGTADNQDFDELGLTFSTPRVVRVKYYDSSNVVHSVVALIFAGGYSVNKDTQTDTVGSNDSEGNAIYIVNAHTGELIKSFTQYKSAFTGSMVNFPDSIPSSVNTLDTNGDGAVDRLYVGDSGGNIWRVDMPIVYNDNIDDRDHWIAYKFAELGRHASSTTDDDRRFFHKVDVVFSRDSSDPVSRFDAVIVGSGNRANPKDGAYTDTPQNRLFMLKDRSISVVDYSASNPPSALTASSLSNLTDNCFADDSCTDAVKTNLINGWYLNLREEEKMLSSSLTLAGTVFATTYIPTGGLANNSCGPNEGTGFLYAIKLSDATSARINFHLSIDEDPQTESANRIYELGSGIPSSPVAIGDGKVLLPGGKIVKAGDSDGGLTYWYEDNSR